jgi:hypothetical protein
MLVSNPEAPLAQPSREERIAARAREFDAAALVALLRETFPGRAVRFASHPSLATQGTIVRSVEFHTGDEILVTLNLGLASATSPLPSDFLELLADAHIGPALAQLLAVADDRLLGDRVAALAPEASPRLLPGVPGLYADSLTLARPASPVTAHWIFSSAYPELGVTVRRAPIRRGMPAEGLRLGHATLGHAAFGEEAELMVPGLEIVLCSEDTTTAGGLPWLDEARRRLHARIFPALERSSAHLRVLLVVLDNRSRVALQRPSQLGFDSLWAARPRRVSLLFEGRVLIPTKVARQRASV